MVRRALLDLRKPKYHNYKVYIHNLANFDAYFLINELANIGFLSSITHKGNIVTSLRPKINESIISNELISSF